MMLRNIIFKLNGYYSCLEVKSRRGKQYISFGVGQLTGINDNITS